MGKEVELIDAARNGNVEVVGKLLGLRTKKVGTFASLRRGPGPNTQDSSGYTVLHHAALNGHQEVVKLLLEHDASTNMVDHKGSSPLHLAAWTGNEEMVHLLLSHGPSIPDVNLMFRQESEIGTEANLDPLFQSLWVTLVLCPTNCLETCGRSDDPRWPNPISHLTFAGLIRQSFDIRWPDPSVI
ncbi:unnamed protein product [Cyprideis torosa]|uniref:Uncharacterized protein n=1 Tax=Cyprideis torosa TaxID=163714 RepID=A0A7R8WEI2_9CRUS|nr:unnamed protein product [Cyprideis torosa]CAG0895818.1 unnamed protein product [Cyprideis torosa]